MPAIATPGIAPAGNGLPHFLELHFKRPGKFWFPQPGHVHAGGCTPPVLLGGATAGNIEISFKVRPGLAFWQLLMLQNIRLP